MNENINQTKISYQGLVDIKYLVNGKEINYKGHNEGLNAMFKYLCKLLAGDTSSANNDKPAYLDVKYEYSLDGEFRTTSVLYNVLSISNPEYFFDTSVNPGRWVTRFSIVIAYNMINFDLIETLPEEAVVALYLLSNSRQEFARLYLKDDSIQLTDIVPGTQALVQWTMILENKSN